MGDDDQPPAPGTSTPDAEETYTLPEIAKAARMTPRNVRSYATKGLIDKPRRRGRVSHYSDLHLRQLAWVRELHLVRGLPLAVVRTLVERAGGEHDPLGLELPPRPGLPTLVDLREPLVAPASPAPGSPGDETIAVSVHVALPPHDPRTRVLLRDAHRLADLLGYVHDRDSMRADASFHRISTWHRVDDPAGRRTAPAKVGRAVEDVVRAVQRVAAPCVVLVGDRLVAHVVDGGGPKTVSRLLGADQARLLATSTDLLGSPPRAARLGDG